MLESTSAIPPYAPLLAHAVTSRLLGTNKYKEMIRGFYHLKEAWYGDANLANRHDGLVDEVMIGFYGPDGEAGTTGEFCIQWIDLKGKACPQLQVFDDAWDALAYFSDLLEEMAKFDNKTPSPTEFCGILKRLGIKDLTPRKNPHRAVDHIDGDPYNNDPANLRVVTLSENRR